MRLFYPSFNIDFHVIKSFGNDIHVLYIWVLVLVDVFDECVHDFYNVGYLRLVMVKI